MITSTLTSRRARLAFFALFFVFIVAFNAVFASGAEPINHTEQSLFDADSAMRFREQPPHQGRVEAASDYAFNETPADALQVLQQLKAFSRKDPRGAALERQLVEDVMDGRLDDFSYGDAALIASGVFDPDKRQRYLRKLQRITAQASDVTADLEGKAQKAKGLLTFLHEKVLKRGYKKNQTRLDRLLDRGRYNCVSSAVIYNLVGVNLGLELRAIEVPDHALSIFYDGEENFDVETTNAHGFAPSQNARQKFEATTGFNYTPGSDKDRRREISTLNLIGVIYYNKGVDLSRKGRHTEALDAYFKALSFDKKSNSSVKNILAVLVNWSGQLVKEQKFEQALKVINVGLILAPEDTALNHQHEHAWSARVRYSLKHGAAGKTAEFALQAYKEIPGEYFEHLQAWVFEQLALTAIDAGEYKQALSIMEKTLQGVSPTMREPLHVSRAGLLHHIVYKLIESDGFDQAEVILNQGLAWYPEDELLSQQQHYYWTHRARLAMTAGQWQKAADIYGAALKKFPDSDVVNGNLLYLTQSWVQDDRADAQKIFANVLERFPNHPKLKPFAQNESHYIVQTLIEEGAYEAALRWLHTDNLLTEEASLLLTRSLYFQWAEMFSKQQNYEQAINTYQRGLVDLPGDEGMMQNIVVDWYALIRPYMDAGDWTHAIRLYKRAIKTSDHPSLLNNLRYCEDQQALAE
ncbi:MAG: hypothetical protein COA42_16530 [Alteromonadaceae bacterium]|nr:MAG: hypothetical protein COA42_16530 [Alteromonadaceae bacterium]